MILTVLFVVLAVIVGVIVGVIAGETTHGKLSRYRLPVGVGPVATVAAYIGAAIVTYSVLDVVFR